MLYAWPVEDELEESVNFMGSSVLNSSTSETVPVLEVEVRAPNVQRGKAIVYPLHERIEHVAREASKGMISPVSVCVCVGGGVMCHCVWCDVCGVWVFVCGMVCVHNVCVFV